MSQLHSVFPVEGLVKKLEERKDRKEDMDIPVAGLKYKGNGMISMLQYPQKREVKPNQTAWDQILGELGIPADFFMNTLTEYERINIFNRLAGDSESQKMFRVMNSLDNAPDTLYATVSTRYRKMDHDALIPILAGSDVDVGVVKGTRLNTDHGKFRLIPLDVGSVQVGDHVPMVEFNNSESGKGALVVSAGVYTLICTNGMMVPLKGFNLSYRVIHLGRELGDVNLPEISEIFEISQEYVIKMYEAESQYLSWRDKVNALKGAQTAGITRSQLATVVSTIDRYYGGGQTLAQVIGGFTQAAQGFEPETRTQIESYAGTLL